MYQAYDGPKKINNYYSFHQADVDVIFETKDRKRFLHGLYGFLKWGLVMTTVASALPSFSWFHLRFFFTLRFLLCFAKVLHSKTCFE